MHSWLAAVADPRIAASAPMIGVQSFGWALQNDAFQVGAWDRWARLAFCWKGPCMHAACPCAAATAPMIGVQPFIQALWCGSVEGHGTALPHGCCGVGASVGGVA